MMTKAITKYKYHFRPGYNSNEFLIEIFRGGENPNFMSDFLNAIKSIAPSIVDIKDIWMNDEMQFELDSTTGQFSVFQDIWGLVFIMAPENQEAISRIHSLLVSNPNFSNIPVNNEDYKMATSQGSE